MGPPPGAFGHRSDRRFAGPPTSLDPASEHDICTKYVTPALVHSVGWDLLTKIQNRQVDKSYEIYLSLYQAVTGSDEERNIYRQLSRDFFGLVVVDECHRGSAAEDAAWREILEHFPSATQIGMTATPKETKQVSNIEYFGEPIYTYSLKQGIEDGFLAPYKVVRIDIDKDLTGWRPEDGKVDKHGQVIEDLIYNARDFDRTLILEKRTELVARKLTSLPSTGSRTGGPGGAAGQVRGRGDRERGGLGGPAGPTPGPARDSRRDRESLRRQEPLSGRPAGLGSRPIRRRDRADRLGALVKRCYHSSIEQVSLEVRMNTRFSEDVIPLTDLKVNPGRVVKHAAESRRPVLLTSRGRGVAVIQSVAEYEKEQEERGFLRAVVEGLADLEEGREVSLAEAKARLGLK